MTEAILDVLRAFRESTVFPLVQHVAWWLSCGATSCLGAVLVSGRRDAVLEAVKEAMRMADIPLTAAAIDMGVCKSLLSRKLSGEKSLSVDALAAMSDEFWQWFAVALAARVGVPATVTVGARLARRQARMTIQQQKEGVA